jgi:hypothetical protein
MAIITDGPLALPATPLFALLMPPIRHLPAFLHLAGEGHPAHGLNALAIYFFPPEAGLDAPHLAIPPLA